jgi:hypothetical protein
VFSKQFELFGNPVSVDIHLVTRLSEELQVTQDAIVGVYQCGIFNLDTDRLNVFCTQIRQGEGFILVYCVTDQESFSQCVNMQQQILYAFEEPFSSFPSRQQIKVATNFINFIINEFLSERKMWTAYLSY